ncbi:MAG: hypothetical protein K0Q68_2953 [Moraxellaceae bacterium]|jgi:hypothetical protein|nr:hypothetical protein [Moraxellaceae bacterium]
MKNRRSLLRYAWAAPCSALGLLLAPLCWRHGSAQVVSGVLELALGPAPYRGRLRFHAITLGHVIVGTDPVALAQLRAHEFVHVRQYERWGPLFIPAYLGAGLYQWLRGKNPHRDNYFEIQAREQGDEPRIGASPGPRPD